MEPKRFWRGKDYSADNAQEKAIQNIQHLQDAHREKCKPCIYVSWHILKFKLKKHKKSFNWKAKIRESRRREKLDKKKIILL